MNLQTFDIVSDMTAIILTVTLHQPLFQHVNHSEINILVRKYPCYCITVMNKEIYTVELSFYPHVRSFYLHNGGLWTLPSCFESRVFTQKQGVRTINGYKHFPGISGEY